MKNNYIDVNEIKRKIRNLKKLEQKLRYGTVFMDQKGNKIFNNDIQLLWNQFFDLHNKSDKKVKYSLEQLLKMNSDDIKNVIDEFVFALYVNLYSDSGTLVDNTKEELLIDYKLNKDIDMRSIKKRFHELAKQYHPDAGGDAAEFIKIMEQYHELLKKEKDK